MKIQEKYDWVDFYKSFGIELLKYKNDRKTLIELIKKIFQDLNDKLPTLEKDNIIEDIDPFTVYGLFNKNNKIEKRINIINKFIEFFEMNTQAPTNFEGVPTLNNKNATFYYFKDERGDNDINELWDLLEAALNYSQEQSDNNKSALEQMIKKALSIRGIAIKKLTMGLFWINPNIFFNLDSTNQNYIYNSEKFDSKLIDSLKNLNEENFNKEYFIILEKLKAYMKKENCEFKNFIELSSIAYKSKDLNNIPQKVQKELNKSTYTKTDFLNDIFISNEKYNDLIRVLEKKKNIILQGPPGVGKTFIAKKFAYSILGKKDDDKINIVQFHQSYSYEDFVIGYRPNNNNFELQPGPFYEFCLKAASDTDNKYFFIIDEINRGNLSKIFGELFMLIEEDKRGDKIQLIYHNEKYNQKFSIPNNLYLIGTMNTADRSLALLDYALRRRFAFFDLEPAFDTDKFNQYKQKINNEKFNKLIECIKELNNKISQDESLGDGFRIGHSYFCNLKENESDETLKDIIDFEIIPLLKEYWYDEKSNVETWINKLGASIK